MSIPTAKDLQPIDPILQNILVGYAQQETRFVADRVFPAVPVDKDSGTYFIFTKKYWSRDTMQARAYGAQYARSDFGVETDTYKTMQWSLAKPIADEERANSQLPMDLETASVRYLGMQAMIRRERLFAAAAMASSVWGTTATVSNKWSDYTNSDPVNDVLTGKRTVSQATGYTPNTMVMGEIVRDRLVNHPDLIDRIKFTQAATQGSVETALAALFGVQRLLIGSSIVNTANEGQTASMSPIVDDDVLLVYTPAGPGMFEPSGGYTFTWAPGGGLATMQPMVREDDTDSDLVKIKAQFVHKIVATDVGYFFADVTD